MALPRITFDEPNSFKGLLGYLKSKLEDELQAGLMERNVIVVTSKESSHSLGSTISDKDSEVTITFPRRPSVGTYTVFMNLNQASCKRYSKIPGLLLDLFMKEQTIRVN